MLDKLIPLLTRFVLDGSRSNIYLQPNILIETSTLWSKTSLNHLSYWSGYISNKALYPNWIEYNLRSFSSQHQTSVILLFHWTLDTSLKSSCSNSNSHTNNSLLHDNIHINFSPFPLTHSPILHTFLSLSIETEYNLRNLSFK